MWYLKSAFDAYQKVQDAVQSRFGEVQAAIRSPMETMQKLLRTAASQTRTEEEPELSALRKRVAELEARLSKAPAKRRPKTKRAKPKK